MKATNIFNSLKAKGVCGTDGIPPKLPGVSAAKFNAELREASAAGELNPGFKAAVDADTKKTSPTNYGTKAGPLKNNPEKGKLIRQEDLGGGRTKSYYEVPGSNMPRIITTKRTVQPPKPKPSPATKKSCGYNK